MGVPKGAGNLRGARDKNWTVVAACLRSFRRALAAVHPEPARGPTLVTSATQLEIGEPCEFSAKPLNSPKFLDVTLQSRPTENGVSPPLKGWYRTHLSSMSSTSSPHVAAHRARTWSQLAAFGRSSRAHGAEWLPSSRARPSGQTTSLTPNHEAGIFQCIFEGAVIIVRHVQLRSNHISSP